MKKRWPYPKYKPFGVGARHAVPLRWEIPVHWEVKRLKHVARINLNTLTEGTEPDCVIKYIDIGNVGENGLLAETEEMIFGNAPSRARRIIKKDNVIISTVRTYLKAIAHFPNPENNLVCSTGFAVLEPGNLVIPRFIYYLACCDEFIETIMAYSVGVRYPAINASVLANFPVWLPSVSEQRAIAAYLDTETAKINALVATKERFIELLAEKRTALISQAVTKGLDPNVPLKDSGVGARHAVPLRWEIPAHWEVKRLKHVVSSLIVKGNSVKRPFVALEYIMSGFAKLVNDYEYPIADASEYALFEEGDILFGKLRPYLRKYWLANFSGCCPTELLVLRPDEEQLDRKFFYYFIQSAYFIAIADGTSYGVKMPRTSWEKLGWMSIVFPDIYEQRTIATYLDAETAKIDALITKTRESIEKLKEYRTALISAAVTGKIDVREEAP